MEADLLPIVVDERQPRVVLPEPILFDKRSEPGSGKTDDPARPTTTQGFHEPSRHANHKHRCHGSHAGHNGEKRQQHPHDNPKRPPAAIQSTDFSMPASPRRNLALLAPAPRFVIDPGILLHSVNFQHFHFDFFHWFAHLVRPKLPCDLTSCNPIAADWKFRIFFHFITFLSQS